MMQKELCNEIAPMKSKTAFSLSTHLFSGQHNLSGSKTCCTVQKYVKIDLKTSTTFARPPFLLLRIWEIIKPMFYFQNIPFLLFVYVRGRLRSLIKKKTIWNLFSLACLLANIKQQHTWNKKKWNKHILRFILFRSTV